MSVIYLPDNQALNNSPWNITFLSQRDVAAQVPINYVTSPAVSLSAACFGNGRYETSSAVRCVSNLLAGGFAKITADLYWDAPRRTWSFCPVQLPQPSATTTAAGATVTLNSTIFPPPPAASKAPANPPYTDTLYSLGPYTCSSRLELPVLASLIADFMSNTDNTLAANVNYFVFNVHAASPSSDPLAPAAMPSNASLPAGADLISSVLNANLSSFVYTPPALASERSNVVTSWNSSYIEALEDDDSFYYESIVHGVDDVSSPDGWPSEAYLVLHDRRRLLLGLGSVDPQMQYYDVATDAQTLFVDNTLDPLVNISLTADGTITQGCFFNPNSKQLGNVNSSWAVTTSQQLEGPLLATGDEPRYAIENVTSCGISPLLNQTLDNSTADSNVDPYQQFVFDAVWSWAPGEPRNDSNTTGAILSSPATNLPQSSNFRCALFDSAYSGRWTVTYCEESFPVACRDPNNPFSWSVSATNASYTSAYQQCGPGSEFAVPRTGLENRYLLDAVNAYAQRNPSASPWVWINYNSRSAESCWVQGANTSCPYMVEAQQNDASIIVPTVAMIIIIILALATLLVKCGANRSNSRKRRKVYDGWDYEGVPS